VLEAWKGRDGKRTNLGGGCRDLEEEEEEENEVEEHEQQPNRDDWFQRDAAIVECGETTISLLHIMLVRLD
jgi:hypothetical protein